MLSGIQMVQGSDELNAVNVSENNRDKDMSSDQHMSRKRTDSQTARDDMMEVIAIHGSNDDF